MPKGDRFSRVLDEERFSLEADGPRAVRGRYLLDAKGRQRTCPILDAHVEPAEDIVDGSMRSESGRLGSPDSADTLCVSSDPLDGVFGRIMEASSILHVVGGRGLSRNVIFRASFPISRSWRTCMGPMPQTWPVRSMSLSTVPLPTSCPQNSETHKRNQRRMLLTLAPVWRSHVTSCWSESFLVVQMVTVTKMMTERRKAGEAPGLARRNDVSSGGGRPPARPTWKKGHLAASERGSFSSTTSSRPTGVVFQWLDWRTATKTLT